MHKHRSPKSTKCSSAPPRELSHKALKKAFREFKLPRSDESRVIEEFFISLDTPVALSCLILFRHGEFEQLVSKEINPIHYNDRFLFRDDFAAISFLRKCKFLKTGIDKGSVALQNFKNSEMQCLQVNNRFLNLVSDPLYKGANVWLLHATSQKIQAWLGDFSPDELFDKGSWGPGVSHTIKGDDVSASRKFREESGITAGLYHLVGDLMPIAYPLWGQALTYDLAPGNKVITVPKNAKTDRTIAIEPGLNIWFQLGMGKIIRRKLRNAGFDLNSDYRNQNSALIGSKDGSLATVDFSAASDTISRNLVREILPKKWFFVLDTLRSPCYELDGSMHIYEKFSAMGNGFTFELESMIFVAAAYSVCLYLNLPTDSISVFGDDIIIPKEAFSLYSSYCKFLGFTVNHQKSFSDGYFRESCGSYFFDGLDVKPLFLKESIKDAKSIFRLANSIRLLAHRRNINYGCDNKLFPVWKYLVRRLPRDLRLKGPRSSGDSTIHVNFDEGRPVIARGQWCGFLHPGLLTMPISRPDDHISLLIARIWSPSRDRSYGNEIYLRAKTKEVLRKRLFAEQWYNFGPWF